NNKQAKAVLPVLVIRAWLSAIETDPQKIDAALKELREQQKADPRNADVAFFIAWAMAKQADANANSVGAPSGEALYAEAIKSMESSLSGQDDNGDLQFRAAQFFDLLRRRLPNKELKEKFAGRLRAHLERAVAVLKPQDRFYADARIRMVDLLAAEGKTAQAEKICHEAIEQKT